ncbi:multiple sugar transport system substrate-binding protein [Paenibacillus phyllosphaerae]|uniref:Multiple sugar transport system substrate-binding protein n=1 Tax=Paenibacillus phyllosphaerae TaxID=274593 RepID=A0A7W5FMV6_9BACL|nr:extracellular solute-binding protein [Paenibacillus phyllosphaerae]MBB3110414.1 multiple sugar transport system substrate-binding protein [Paenibacillus phyllosphaerae]
MKKMASLLLAMSLTFSLAACGGNNNSSESSNSGEGSTNTQTNAGTNVKEEDAKPVTLRMAWWGSQPRHDYTLKVIEMYEKEHPNVKIESEYANFDDYWKKLAPQAAANELPDIVQMDISYLAQYGQKGQLEDLTPYLNNGIDTSNISENSISGGKLGDKIYGFNIGVNTMNFQYDPELLKKLGVDKPSDDWTWEDYFALASKAKEAGLYFDGGMRPEVFFGYYLRSKGAHLYNADGTALGYEDDQMFVDFFKPLANLVKEGDTPPPDVKAQIKGLEDDMLVKNKQVGIWQWTNQFVAIQQVANRSLEMAHMPGPGRNEGLYLKPSMYFSISKNSENKEEAAKFIDFWVNNVEANKLIKGDRGVPVNTQVAEGIKSTLDPAQVQVFDYVTWAQENSSPMDPPDPVGTAEIIKLFAGLAEQMDFQKLSAEDAAKQFRKEANAILAKNKQ